MDNLTDLEICKRIAEIEGYESIPYEHLQMSDKTKFLDLGNWNCLPNPLTDKALCFDLMIKHEIDIHPLRCGMGVYHKVHWEIHLNGGDFEEFSLSDKNPQRAICLAIIAKHGKENS